MKYYLIVGEASGDLHAAELMKALKNEDEQASFRFFGGEKMKAVGGSLVKHYKELAYMGFIPVLLHLRTILRNMKLCKDDIINWNPDVLILVDYPGFNLSIAKYIRKHTKIPIYYYISPKIWAWKEHRITAIKRDVDALFSILPFEVDFYEKKHSYPIHYIGNPTVDEVDSFVKNDSLLHSRFLAEENLIGKPIIALLAGSRKQEIKDNLPRMIKALKPLEDDYQFVLAGAPSIDKAYYERVVGENRIKIVFDHTYALLQHAHVALVTSGTATLETALFRTPQVVCYYMPMGKMINILRKLFLKVRYISLVNLIADRPVVPELVGDQMNPTTVYQTLQPLLVESDARTEMLHGYELVSEKLGKTKASINAAQKIVELLRTRGVSCLDNL